MDKHEAKFILSSFRPDGADADSSDFAEALRLAAADRELGDWLAAERARDAAFAGALSRVELPESLREEILGSLAAERGEMPGPDGVDRAFSDALEGLRPPDGLRREILIAMEKSAPRKTWWSWKWAAPLAAAAGVAVALLPRGEQGPGVEIPRVAGAVPVNHVEEVAIRTLSSPDFSFHLENPDRGQLFHDELFRFIRSKGSPCPEGCLPKGLRDVPGIGCRKLEIDGKAGALVCFLRGEGDVVHLVVFRTDDVEGMDAESTSPRIEQHGKWAVARWAEKGRAFLLISTSDREHLGELF